MDQKDLHEWEARCIQEEPPACRAGCPLGVDARGFVQAIVDDNLAGARAILEKSMPLAGIVARICEAPCEQYCLRKGLGGPVAIGLLERMCIRAVPAKGKILRLPPRPKKIAVIGSAPSGLTVAYDLAKKGYPVSLFHLQEKPGGWLRSIPEVLLEKEVLEEELTRLTELGVTFHGTQSLNASLWTGGGFDAFYIGQDDDVAEGDLVAIGEPDKETFALPEKGLFTGGLSAEDHPFRFITDVSQGREAAVSMDRFLQGASLTAARVALRHGKTDLYTSLLGINFHARVVPAAETAGYTRKEAEKEAARCINCQCLECVKRCRYLEEFGAYPKTYARRIYNNSAIVKGSHQANKFINSCSLCGQCETICPNDFSMADLCLDARRTMVQEERMPGFAHWFALEEMRSARSEAALVRHAPGRDVSTTLFYPGCQLAGIRPDQTLHLYEYLRELDPATGLWLDCCGAPAHWGGRKEEFSTVIEELRQIWRTMGKPLVLTACSSCLKMFREHLPEMEVESVWVLLSEKPPVTARAGAAMALSDPCTSRHDIKTQTAVRNMLDAIGQPLAPLEMSGELTECCGFGGLMESANPVLAKKVTKARGEQTDSEILTYCAMCRDQLARTGKPVSHILDLLFGFEGPAHGAAEPAPTLSARRINRRQLKNTILTRYSGEPRVPEQEWERLRLYIEPAVSDLLEERRIIEDDIRKVLYQTKQKGTGLVHGESSSRIASAQIGQVTFWVEYKEIQEKEENIFHIMRCWSHRMTVTLPGGLL